MQDNAHEGFVDAEGNGGVECGDGGSSGAWVGDVVAASVARRRTEPVLEFCHDKNLG